LYGLIVLLIPEYIKKEGVSLSKKPVKTGFTGFDLIKDEYFEKVQDFNLM
jgi:hypothetical protein